MKNTENQQFGKHREKLRGLRKQVSLVGSFFLLFILLFSFVVATNETILTSFNQINFTGLNKTDFVLTENLTHVKTESDWFRKQHVWNQYGRIDAEKAYIKGSDTLILPLYVSVEGYENKDNEDFTVSFYTGDHNVTYSAYKKNGFKLDYDDVKKNGKFYGSYQSVNGYVFVKTKSFSTFILDTSQDLVDINYCLHPDHIYTFDLADFYSFVPDCQISSFDHRYIYKVYALNGNSADTIYKNVYASSCYQYSAITGSIVPGIATDNTLITVPSGTWEGDLTIALYDTQGTTDTLLYTLPSLSVSSTCVLPVVTPPVSNGLGDGVISHYKGDVSGTYVDEQGNNDGTPYGGASSVASSISDGAYSFDGVDDYISIPSSNMFQSGDFTYSMWARIDAVGNSYDNVLIHQKGTSNYQDFVFYWIDTTQLRLDMADGIDGRGTHIFSQSTNLNEWYQFTVTHDNNYDTVYLNGIQIQQFTSSPVSFTSPSALSIGTTFYGTRYFDGKIDEVTILNRAWTSDEVLEAYNGGTPLSFPFGILSTPALPVQTNIPDISLAGNELQTIDLTSYITGASSYMVKVEDPFTPGLFLTFQVGYASLFADYIDFGLITLGSLTAQSYSRDYTTDIELFSCSELDYTNCVSQIINVVAEPPVPQIVQHQPFNALYNLGFTLAEKQTFTINSFFQYHDTIEFIFPDSNYTGILNENFSFPYSTIAEPVNNASFLVLIKCNISEILSYNYLGDINISIECGNEQADFTLTTYNNYNQTVYFDAANSLYNKTDYFLLHAGNPSVPAGWIPPVVTLNHNDSEIDFKESYSAFSELFPSADSFADGQPRKITFMLTLIIVVCIFLLVSTFTRFRGIVLALVLSFIAGLIVLFFFAFIGYISSGLPILILIITVLGLLIKFFGLKG